jgi:hypothetical protein
LEAEVRCENGKNTISVLMAKKLHCSPDHHSLNGVTVKKSRQMLSSVLMAKKLHCSPYHHSPLAIDKLKNTGSTIIEPQRSLASS